MVAATLLVVLGWFDWALARLCFLPDKRKPSSLPMNPLVSSLKVRLWAPLPRGPSRNGVCEGVLVGLPGGCRRCVEGGLDVLFAELVPQAPSPLGDLVHGKLGTRRRRLLSVTEVLQEASRGGASPIPWERKGI